MDLLERLKNSLGDRYQIEREIGAGGMATVYLAEDARHHRKVAIKVLHPELSAVLGTDRFLKEIELTANLQHPHILPLFDSGNADGLLYYVMPYVEGETLRGRLSRENQLPVADSVRIATEVADALEYAHKCGVIHRDVKPENILLRDGRVLVADFGIALALQQAGGSRMTQTGMSLGTPQYMAPEQAMGDKHVDHRADIYALGAVTYEMLAGEPPFTGPTPQAIVAKVITSDPVALSEKRRSVPPHVDGAVLTALEKTPADRFGTAREFAAALSEPNTGATIRIPTGGKAISVKARPRSALVQTLAWAIAALIVGGGIGWAARRQPRVVSAPMKFLLIPDSVKFRTECCGNMLLLTGDGRTLIFQGAATTEDSGSATRAVAHALYARDLGELVVRQLPGTEGAVSLFLSPDGREIGFVARRILYRLPIRGDQPQEVVRLPNGFIGGGTWMTDGRIVIAVNYVLYVVNASGGELRPLVTGDPSRLQATSPFFVKEANAILYTRASLETQPVIEWLSVSSGKSRRVIDGATPTYVASARALLTVRPDGTLVSYPFNAGTGEVTGPAVRVGQNVSLRSPVYAYAEYAASANGAVVLAERSVAGSGGSATVMMETVGGQQTRLAIPGDVAHFDLPRFSPDGSRMAIAAQDRGTNLHSIYIYDFARNAPVRLTTDQNADQLAWNRSSDSLIYRIGAKTFVIRAANRTGDATELLRLRDWVSTGSLDVNGPWIAFSGELTNSFRIADIVVAHRDSAGLARPYVATSFSETEPAISPDGHWLAFTSDETGRPEVYVSTFPVAGARVPVSRGGGRGAVWGRDGRTIYYATVGRDYDAVRFNPGNPPSFGEERTIYQRDFSRAWTIDPDGHRLIFTDVSDQGQVTGMLLILNAVPDA
jgi:Tol biopolymer transport system component/tRNA A-37 threonylcarbamoyl transferase component Bud32